MAAYRSATLLHDPETGEVVDYGRKQGVLHSQIIVPENAPDWATNRQELWGRSETAHRRKDAIIAREIQLSLPHEISHAERRELATRFARYISETYQVAVDLNIHAPNRDGDERNYHAHLLLCTRSFDERKSHGLGNNVRSFDAISHQRNGTENHVETWRAEWEKQINDALQRADVCGEDGVTVEMVSHKSHARRGLEAEPTIKEGIAATAQKRRGQPTERAAQNDEIRQRNAERSQLAEEIDADVQALELLLQRQAQLLAAHEARKAITPTPDPVQTLTPRSAKDLNVSDALKELAGEDPQAPESENTVRLLPWETGTPNPITPPVERRHNRGGPRR
jgi:hypothetical protein